MLGGATSAEACSSFGALSLSPGFSLSLPNPQATLNFNLDGCQQGDQISIEFAILTTILETLSATVPAGVTGATSISYPFTAGDSPACAGTGCELAITVRVSGSHNESDATTLTYPCSNPLCSGTNQFNFGTFAPTWTQTQSGASGTSTSAGGQQITFARLQNPISYNNIPDVIRQLITIVFIIGVPLVALAIIYAGFLLVTAGGDQNKLTKGKQALLAAVLGGAILLGAWVIAEAIQGTVDQIRGV